MPQMVPEECLPLELPEIETYKPTETGEPPLGRAKKWAWDAEKKEVVDKSLVDNKTVFPLELNTMQVSQVLLLTTCATWILTTMRHS